MVYWNLKQDSAETIINLPITKENDNYVYPKNTEFHINTDIFIPEMVNIITTAFKIMKERSDCKFVIMSRNIDIEEYLPNDWNGGYNNVEISCVVENQKQLDLKLPSFNKLPIKNKSISISPIISRITLSGKLTGIKNIKRIRCNGESGSKARPCREEWIRDLYNQSRELCIPFSFTKLGSRFYTLNNTELCLPENEQIAIAHTMGFQDF